MLTDKLYVLGFKLAVKFFKGNVFMAEEALQNAMINCHKNSNWNKPFVMQCIYNECRVMSSRGYLKRIGEKRTLNNTFCISEERKDGHIAVSEEDFLEEHKRSIEDQMYAHGVTTKVYAFLTNKQKQAFKAYIKTDSMVDGALTAKMNYQTYKTHIRCIMGVFQYYAKHEELPENATDAIQVYKPYQSYIKNKGDRNEEKITSTLIW
jgi:hypothetical protein